MSTTIGHFKRTSTTICRLIKTALLARGAPMKRAELWEILNQSRPAWPFNRGEILDSLSMLERLGQITITPHEGRRDSLYATITLIRCT